MEKCKREGDTLVTTEGLRVFTGMETDIAEGGHILFAWNARAYLRIKCSLSDL